MNQTPQRPRTPGPWRVRRVLQSYWVEARVGGVLVPVAAFTWEQDARAVCERMNREMELRS